MEAVQCDVPAQVEQSVPPVSQVLEAASVLAGAVSKAGALDQGQIFGRPPAGVICKATQNVPCIVACGKDVGIGLVTAY